MKLISTNICLIFFLFVFQFPGCSSTSPSKTPRISDDSANTFDQNFLKEWRSKYDSTLAEIEQNQRFWQDSKITNYDFVIAKYAGGQTNEWNRLPVLMKIREGKKASIEKVEKDKDYVYSSRTDGFEDFDTIDKLFNYLRQELDDRNILEVEYDEKYGYPKMVIIKFTFATNHNTREIDTSKFEVLK